MGDLVRTTLLAWPYPGRLELPCPVLDKLERHHALPPSDDPTPQDFLGDAGVVVLAGDERSGLILAVVDEQASQGIAAYRSLIQALTGAGLHVFAGNEAGARFGGCWEYHPPRGNGARPERRRRAGDVLVVSAFDLLDSGERTVADVPDEVLAGQDPAAHRVPVRGASGSARRRVLSTAHTASTTRTTCRPRRHSTRGRPALTPGRPRASSTISKETW